MVIWTTLVVVIVSIASAAVIVGRHVPSVAAVAPEELEQLERPEPLRVKISRFVSEKHRAIMVLMFTKLIRRLKIISLKTDNMASRLLQALQRRSQQSENEEVSEQSDREVYRTLGELYEKMGKHDAADRVFALAREEHEGALRTQDKREEV